MTKLVSKKNNYAATSDATELLRKILWPVRESIANQWTQSIYGTYPFDTVGFLRTNTDQFANPVGYRTQASACVIIEMLFLQQPDQALLQQEIDEIMRVRSIQNFSPEIAVGIFFVLKNILREKIYDSGKIEECFYAFLELESRIDAVGLMAFGSFARCRETLYSLRVDEVKRTTSQLVRLATKKDTHFDEN